MMQTCGSSEINSKVLCNHWCNQRWAVTNLQATHQWGTCFKYTRITGVSRSTLQLELPWLYSGNATPTFTYCFTSSLNSLVLTQQTFTFEIIQCKQNSFVWLSSTFSQAKLSRLIAFTTLNKCNVPMLDNSKNISRSKKYFKIQIQTI